MQVRLACQRLAFPTLVLWGFSLSNQVPMYPSPRHACKIGTVRSVPHRETGGSAPSLWRERDSLYNLITI
jgi:hypothetical protein